MTRLSPDHTAPSPRIGAAEPALHANRAGLATWAAFLVIAFGAVGLIGAFGTYASELPFDRAMARSATLDRVLAAAHGPSPAREEAALRPLLGDSADAVLNGQGPIEARVEAERRRVFAELHDEAAIYGFRFRCYIALFTAMAALFGTLILGLSRPQEAGPQTWGDAARGVAPPPGPQRPSGND